MRLLLIVASGFLAAAPAWAGTGRLIVGFIPESSLTERTDILNRNGMTEVADLGELSAKVVELETPAGSSESPMKLASFRLMSEPGVFHVEEDFYYKDWLRGVSFQASPLPDLPEVMGVLTKFEKKDATEDEQPWGIQRVNAKGAWPRTEGAGVKVAVIDTGIDFNHPDLKANYAGGYNAIDSQKPPMDDNSHGTHVAGTIAGVRDGKGVVGVAPKAKLYAVKVLDADGGGSLSSIIKGLVWTANNGMQVANMSLGAPMGTVFMRLAVKYARARGVVIMAAAGNEGGPVGYPAAYGDTIAISASDSKDKIAEFSSRGKEVDFIAPGVDVKSSVPGGGYDRYSGTSMATPHMTGLAALAVAQGATGFDGVMASLKRASKKLPGLTANEQGNGLVDASLIKK
ncbi:MAG: hypothetical protein A2X36_14660 [Elusimicrobia bacterium GWA2_69_24]|nr:MAG: hypothetical protein A2X36_14660 [Elusimicrobia bacterium GWA2_69_24]HBL17644.1 hypothetical protein [Elusimicrobiota bacterium]